MPLQSSSYIFRPSAVSAAGTVADPLDKVRESGPTKNDASFYEEMKKADDTVASKATTISLDAVPSTSITPADSYGKRIEKPLPGVMIRESEHSADPGFEQGFFSCACKPCSTRDGTVKAEVSEMGAFGIALSEVTIVVPRNGEHVEEVSKVMSL